MSALIFPHFDSRTCSSFKFSSKLVTFTDPHVPPTNVICFAVHPWPCLLQTLSRPCTKSSYCLSVRTGWWRCGCVRGGSEWVLPCCLFPNLVKIYFCTQYKYVREDFSSNSNLWDSYLGMWHCLWYQSPWLTNPLICETQSTFMYDMITGLFCAISRLYITYILHLLSLLQSKIKTHS